MQTEGQVAIVAASVAVVAAAAVVVVISIVIVVAFNILAYRDLNLTKQVCFLFSLKTVPLYMFTLHRNTSHSPHGATTLLMMCDAKCR